MACPMRLRRSLHRWLANRFDGMLRALPLRRSGRSTRAIIGLEGVAFVRRDNALLTDLSRA